ncbi:MAG: hypothetical protein HWD61_01665 [Parachlamydiaceae bacterium]|nr:MAG: hypothetical protein HWD61_01665 [Parachlamydiaceae bacterium]
MKEEYLSCMQKQPNMGSILHHEIQNIFGNKHLAFEFSFLDNKNPLNE